MAQQLEAIYENGVLRPLEPLALKESQRVTVTIADAPVPDALPADEGFDPHRYAEQAWLRANNDAYRGQWVALHGDRLVSHGPDALKVHDEALKIGVLRPLLVHVPDESEAPSFGSFEA